jgi:hypothetical protein
MAAAVEHYTMPAEFLRGKENSLIPAVSPPDDAAGSPTPTNDVDLPRAASYTYFPVIQNSFLDLPSTSPIKGSFSVENLLPDFFPATDDASLSSGDSGPDLDPSPPLEIISENTSEKPKATVLRNGLPKLATTNATTERSKDVTSSKDGDQDTDELTSLPASPAPSSLSSRFRRRSWMPGSRSPSPRKSTAPDSPVDGPAPSSKGVRAGRRNSLRQSMTSDNASDGKDKENRSRSTSLSRRLSNKLRGRTLSTITDGVTSEDTTPVPPITSAMIVNLPKSFSTEKLPLSTLNRPIPIADRIPPVPRAVSQERRRVSKAEPTRKRDELWTVFRNLDGDYQK